MLEKQLLTIVAVIKKLQLKLKNNDTSVSNINTTIKELQKNIKRIDNKELIKVDGIQTQIDTIKSQLQAYSKLLDSKEISYTKNNKDLSKSLELSLNDINSKLINFITKDDLSKLEGVIDNKLKEINKIEPTKQLDIKIGEVKTISPGEEASIDIKKRKDTYILDFFIPRGVSGRGMPGKGVASGGTTNQVLAKNSDDDYDTKWITGGGGGTSAHSELTELDYASAGHTGFQPAGNYVEDVNYVHTDNNFTDAFETKLTGIEAGAEVNVQADWNQTTNTADDYIKNKPTIPSAYVLPTASTTILGGVKIDGSTINIDGNGVISAVTGGSGDVTGPASATSGNLAVFDGTTGKKIKDGGAIPVVITDHTALSNIGTNSHTTIDTKLSSLENDRTILKEPTGFLEPENVIVTYDETTQKVTLTGTVTAYYRGIDISVANPTFVSGWLSTAHTSTPGVYFLYYDGANFQWGTSFPDFSVLQIAIINYRATNSFGNRECHGFMNWQDHKNFHYNIGTYRTAGGDITNIVPSSTTADNRRPIISECTINDEDCVTINPALTSKKYSQRYLSSADTINYTLQANDIVPLLTNNPYYNSFTSPNFGQTLMPANSVMTVWLYEVPTTADAASQEIRHVFVQGQSITQATNASAGALVTARNTEKLKTPLELNLGVPAVVAAEYVCIHKFIIQYSGGNWSITDSIAITGSRANQVGSPSGNYLTEVTTDTTLTGNGTVASPLVVANPVTPQATGFTISAGTTPKTLTVSDTASITGTNTGDNAANTSCIAKTTNVTAINDTGISDGEIALFNLTNKDIRTSDKTIVTTLGADDTTVPTSKAVKDVTDGKQATLVSGTNIKTINSTTLLGSGDLAISEFTDEKAQDAVGTILTDTNTIDFTYTDATPSITADVKDASITYAKIQNVSATDRILGRDSAGAGSIEEITPANLVTMLKSSLVDLVYPVGSIYETTSTDLDTTTKMGTYFGGTWEDYGSGRVLVGKSADTEFDTIGETGGAKTHTHSLSSVKAALNPSGSTLQMLAESSDTWTENFYATVTSNTAASANVSFGLKLVGTMGSSSNLSPYIVIYRYRRTA